MNKYTSSLIVFSHYMLSPITYCVHIFNIDIVMDKLLVFGYSTDGQSSSTPNQSQPVSTSRFASDDLSSLLVISVVIGCLILISVSLCTKVRRSINPFIFFFYTKTNERENETRGHSADSKRLTVKWRYMPAVFCIQSQYNDMTKSRQ